MIKFRLMLAKWKQRIRHLKTETYAIYLASKDARVPWYAKALIGFVVVHTFSPIDLIPDFIPILGYLDDLIITPLGIYLALKMIPTEVMAECRVEAQSRLDQPGPNRWVAAVVIISIWLFMGGFVAFLVFRLFQS
jgi:uncharacterized membrane protein YkvA (DUF1232 family)